MTYKAVTLCRRNRRYRPHIKLWNYNDQFSSTPAWKKRRAISNTSPLRLKVEKNAYSRKEKVRGSHITSANPCTRCPGILVGHIPRY